MEKLKSSADSRMTYDADNSAVRNFFGVDLVEPPDAAVARAARTPGDTTQAFLDDNKDASTSTMCRWRRSKNAAVPHRPR